MAVPAEPAVTERLPADIPAPTIEARTLETPTQAAPAPEVPAPVNVTRLIHEAASKSGLLWVRVPGGGTHPVWHVWHDDGDERGTGPAAYVVSGPGEQWLPWLPDEVELLLRSKDTGGRLLTIHATAREIRPEDPDWDTAVEVLRPERLNAVGDVARRWRESATIHALTPHGRPVESPGSYGDDSGAVPVAPRRGHDRAVAPLALARARRRSPQQPPLLTRAVTGAAPRVARATGSR